MTTDFVDQTAFIDRILQVEEDPTNDFSNLKAIESMDLLSLDEIANKLSLLNESISEHARIAEEVVLKRENNQLTADESATIYLYTMGTIIDKQPFYKYVNDALHTTDFKEKKAYFFYLKLFISALTKLESVALDVTRGAKMDLSEKYSVGRTFVWSTFSSCVPNSRTLFPNPTSDISGPRTIFRIHCSTARNLRPYSTLTNEDEYILLPGTEFKVISIVSPSTGLHVIEIQETNSSNLLHQRQRSSSMSEPKKPFPLVENISEKSINSALITVKDLETINKELDKQRDNNKGIFTNAPINDEQVAVIGTELKSNTTWIELNLSSNKINDLGLTNLSAALVLNTTLKILSLEDNFIGDYGIRLLADGLKQNSTLECLKLTHNDIKESGAKYLAELLRVNTTLISLDLNENLIKSVGMNAICYTLEQYNRTLRKIFMKNNNIKKDSLDAIVGVYAMNYVLEEFEYDLNQFPDDIQEEFDKAKKNREQRREILDKIDFVAVFYLEWKNNPHKQLSREASLVLTSFRRLIEPKDLKTISQYQKNPSKQYLILSCDDKTSSEKILKYCQRNRLNLLLLQTISEPSDRNMMIFNCEDALIYRLVTQIASHYRTCADYALREDDKQKAKTYRIESIAIQQKLVDYLKKRRELLVPKTDINQHPTKSLITDA